MKKNFQEGFLGYFLFYYRILGRRIFINLTLCILVSLFDGIGLAMFMPLLQAVGNDGAAPQQPMGQLHYLTDALIFIGIPLSINVVLTLLVLLFILKGAMKYVQLTYQVKIRHLFMKRIRYNLVGHLQNVSYEGFLKMDAGKIQNVLIMEVQRLFQTMNSYFNAIQTGVMLTTYIVLAFLANYQFALLVAVGAGLTNLIYRKIYIATKKASRDLSARGDDFNGFLIQAIQHFKYLKATNYFSLFSRKLRGVINQTEKLNHKIGAYNAVTVSVKEPMIILVVVLVISLEINVMNASLASILLSLLLFYRALSFLVSVQAHWQTFVQNVGAMHSIKEFTEEMGRMAEPQVADNLVPFQKCISVENIHMAYGSKPVLKGVSMQVQKNSTIAFVGESGSGKTTLANMIAGLINPTNGQICVDRKPLSTLNLNTYRSKIGYISQEPVIFNDNIFNNITFWADRSDENIQRFWKAIHLASLSNFIESLPAKENTALGDNGVLISGGQKQRISIARELYKDAEILIMDEATSALDSETERMIQENIERLHGKYTIIIIAHRLSTIKNVDVIYLLDKGQISASGNFDTMVERSSRFKRMVALQEI